ncbi:M28 family metallopeptidase [Tissierella praeacuta]|uniref:M28 family metallopeptidase n=1 Tax=Tissierella praeacuta TaxID=43131 RepID=UPI003340863A
MFNKIKKKLVYLLPILMFLLTSCKSTEALQNSQITSIKDTLEYLTSEECDGRLPNTEGNKKAQEYIKDKFEKIGLEPYGNSYLFEYNHMGWNINNENYKMVITFLDGDTKECEYGRDFLENIMTNVDFKGELVLDYKDENIENKFVLLEKMDNTVEVKDKAKGVIFPMESFRRGAPKIEEEHITMIQISPSLYKEMLEKGVKEINVNFQVDGIEEEFPQNNVVGVIPGKNRKNAIVITAHFDHVGSKGNMIWKGAIDNGTGVSALLDIVEKLKLHSDKEKLEQDIVFCAFNGEDSLFQGSIPFVEDISTKYENIYNINIDSLGLKNGGRLLVDGKGEENELVKAITSQFKEHGVEAYSDGDIPRGSDHIIFINNDINGVGLSQENIKDVIHTLEDTMDKVDIEYIERLSNILVDFIINNSKDTFKLLDNSLNAVKNLDDILSEEYIKLNFNEYKFIEINENKELIRQDLGFFVSPARYNEDYHKGMELEGFYKIYPEFQLPEKLGNYYLYTVNVFDRSEEYIDDPELDKIYTIEPKIDNIGKIEFMFDNRLSNKDILDNASISIGFVIEDKDIKKIKYTYAEYTDSVISDEDITIGDEVYSPVYKKSNNQLNGLYRKVEKDGKIYKIMITTPYSNTEWQYKTIEESIKVYKELNMSPFIEDILKVLLN